MNVIRYHFYDSLMLYGTVELKREDCLSKSNHMSFKSRGVSLASGRIRQKRSHKKSEVWSTRVIRHALDVLEIEGGKWEGMRVAFHRSEWPAWEPARKCGPQTSNCKELDSANAWQLPLSLQGEFTLASSCETVSREPSQADPDFWPTELWADKCVSFQTSKFVVICYAEIKNKMC